MIKIKTDLIPIGGNRRSEALIPGFITVHETGNTSKGADAATHNKFIRSPENIARPASWHFTVDDHSIYQHIPTSEQAIHAGTNAGNVTSIGIELCVNSDGDFEKTKKNAQDLIAVLLGRFNLTKACIKQHFDWSGKDCPATSRKTRAWYTFLKGIDYKTVNEVTLRTALDVECRVTKAQTDRFLQIIKICNDK